MEVSIRVPCDERRLRRSIKYVLRRSVKTLRIAGACLVVAGVVLMLVGDLSVTVIALLVLGLVYAFGMEPFLVWQSLRRQNPAVRQDYDLIVDDAGFTMKAESYEQRLAWSMIQRVDEEPDAWFLVLSKIQAMAVYKDLLTDQQKMTFAAILARRRSA